MAIANKNAPFGFRLLRPGGKAEPRYVLRDVPVSRAADLMVGDAYAFDGTVGTLGPNVARAGAGDVVAGIVAGIIINPIPASPKGPVSQDYIAAADGGQIIGVEDDDAEFRTIIVFAAPGATPVGSLLATGPGIMAFLVDAAGNQPLAQSRQYINGDTTSTATGQFVLLGLLDSPADNSDANYAQVVVRLSKTQQSQPFS